MERGRERIVNIGEREPGERSDLELPDEMLKRALLESEIERLNREVDNLVKEVIELRKIVQAAHGDLFEYTEREP